MPEHEDLAIDSVIKRQNVAKEGFTTLYVDGATGNDAANGLTWNSAKKTIQGAIDATESWGKIYVKAGSYAEAITLNKPNIKLIGETRAGTEIAPSSAVHVVDIQADHCEVHNIKIVFPTGTGATSALNFGSLKNLINNVWLHNTGDDGFGFLAGTANNEQIIHNCKVTGFLNQMNIAGGSKHVIYENDLILAGSGGVNIYIDSTERCLIFDNYCDGGGAGIGIDSANNTKNAYFHNNLINHGAGDNASENSANNTWRENYYDDGPADIDHDGFGDSHYDVGNPAGTDYDYFPIAKVNGWKAIHGAGAGGGAGDYSGDIMILDGVPYVSDAALQAVWIPTGAAGNPTLSATHVFGEHSMQIVIGAAGVGSAYKLINARDMTVISNINIYAQSDKAGGDSFRFTLYDSAGNYAYWTKAISTAGSWEDCNINPNSAPSGTSLTAPDLTDIVKIEFGNLTASSTYLFDFIVLESLVSSKIGIGYDGFDDAAESSSSVRGHLLLEGDRIGSGYSAASDDPAENTSVRGHLQFIHDKINVTEINTYSDYNDSTISVIQANEEYPVLEIVETGGVIYVYNYVWDTGDAGATPTETQARTEVTHFNGSLFELSKIFIVIDPSTLSGLWDNMSATDKLYIYAKHYDGVSSAFKLLPPVILRDKATDVLVSSPPVETDLGESVVLDTENIQIGYKFIVYMRVNADIALRTFVPFLFGIRRIA